MNFEDDFMTFASDTFSEMRLLAEGAITLFEDETSPLFRLAREANEHAAMTAFNDIGTALYTFRTHVRQLQEAHHKETQRMSASQNPCELQ